MKHFLFSFLLIGTMGAGNLYSNDEVKILKAQIEAYEAMSSGKNAQAHSDLTDKLRKKSRWSVRRNVKSLDLQSQRITQQLETAMEDAEAKLKKMESTISKNSQQIDIDQDRVRRLDADDNFQSAYKKRGTTLKIVDELSDADYDQLKKHGLDLKGKTPRAQMAAISSHDGYAKLREAAQDKSLRGKSLKFKSLYGYIKNNDDLRSMIGDSKSDLSGKLKGYLDAKSNVKKMQAALDGAKEGIEVSQLKFKLAKAKVNAAKLGHILKINMELADVPKMPKKAKGIMGRHGGKLVTCGGLVAGGVTLYHFNDEVNEIYNTHFRPVVKEVGVKTETLGKNIQDASEKEMNVQKSDFDDLLLTPESLKAGIDGFDLEEYKKTLKKNGEKALDSASKAYENSDKVVKEYWKEKANTAFEEIVDAKDCAVVTAKQRIVEKLGGTFPSEGSDEKSSSKTSSN